MFQPRRRIRGSLQRTFIGLLAVLTATGAALVTPPGAVSAAAPALARPVAAAPALAPQPGDAAAYSVLVFSKTAGFRHDSIPTGIATIRQLGAEHDFAVDATENAADFNDANLARYRAVIWLSTTGDVLDDAQQAAFERYIRAGGGYVGIHAAADTEYGWAWYGRLVGAYFAAHPANQQATIKVEDPAHPSTASLPARWSRFDELYNYRTNPRGTAHVLATLDETTYAPGTGAMGADHPIAWCQDYEGGRSWYTGIGHTIESYSEPGFRDHLLGGIQTATGAISADCSASLTSSFEKVTLDSNTNNPMELDIAPDGRVFYLERDGRLQIIKPDTRTTVTAATLDVFTSFENGLLGVTLDPAFATNHWIYLYYSPVAGPPRNLLSRFTVTGDTLDLASEKVVLQVDTQRNTCCHAGGALTFDSAGNIYLATGDNTNPFESNGYAPIDERAGRMDFDAQRTAANTNDLRGKVLRVHPQADGSYTVPAGNLFAPGTAQTRPEIYAMGFRNPFRIGIDPKTDVLYVADYGPDAGVADPLRGPGNDVEWNIIAAPGNYGWPYCLGNNVPYRDFTFPAGPSGPPFDCSAPVNESPNNTGRTQLPPVIAATVDYDYDGNPRFPEIGGGGAPMGGPVYRYDADSQSDRKWPAYYDGKAIFGEWNQSRLYTMQVGADGKSLVDINQLLTGMSTIRPMDFDFGPDGALYLIEWGSGFGGNNDDSGIYRIDYIARDRAPLAVAAGTPTSGQAPLTVQFSSAGSRDPEQQPITYAWNFGDGTSSTAANPSHTYTANGNYTAQLTVTDPAGRNAVANVLITVGNTAPTVTITMPPDGGFFDWGDQVRYAVTVTDPEDGTIDCSKVVLQYSLGHDEHAHPVQQYNGCSGIVQTSPAGGHDAAANLFAVLEASYVDNGGAGGAGPLTGRALLRLQPKRKQAEHYVATGRASGSTAGGEPGVQRESTGDSQGGLQNLSFIEDGDWWSFAPTNLTGITSLRIRAAAAGAGGRIEVRTGAVDGRLLGTATVPTTGGTQVYTDVPVTLAASTATQPLYFVARPPAGSSTGDPLFNVNWVDFLGRGVTDNAPPAVTAAATPTKGTAPMVVRFTGTAIDAEGDTPLTYAWDFGDGGTANTADASHTYTTAGIFVATLTVTDARGAKGQAAVTVDVEAANTSCFGARSDHFTGTELDRTRWSTIVRENQDIAVSGGALILPTAAGDIFAARADATNLVLQPAPAGAWQATTRVTLAADADFQQAGLIVYGDDDNYTKLDLFHGGSRRVQFVREEAGVPRNEAADSMPVPAGFPETFYLRVLSDGTSLTASFSADGETFTPVGRAASLAGVTAPKVGVYALKGGTSSAPVVPARFDWFQLTPDAPAEPPVPSDEFGGPGLDRCRWNAVVRENVSGYRLTGGALQIDVPNGDIYGTGNSGPANFILQTAPPTDWTIATRVDGSAFNEQYQQAGLLVYVDDDNYLKFDYIVDNPPGSAVLRRLEFRSEIGGVVQSPQPQVTNLSQATWQLRMVRAGNTYTAEYSADGVTWTPLGTLTNDLGTTPKVGLFSLGGNQLASKPVSFDYFRLTAPAADAIAPATTAAVTGPTSGGWYTGPATVALTATDNPGGSGVAKIEYQLDDATAWTVYSAPFTISGDGVHRVRYRATDQAGNVETAKTTELKTDATAPVTTAAFAPPNDDGWHAGATPVTLTATDAGSGVATVHWSLDGGPWTTYTGPVDVRGQGQHELLYRSTDTAGNVETLKSAVLKIDGTAPTVIVAGLANGQLYGDSQDVRVSWQAVDPDSGVKATIGTLDGRPYLTGTLQAMYELTLSMHELTVTSTDRAGNQTTSVVRFFVTTSFRDLQNVIDRFRATGRLRAATARTLSDQLTKARLAEAGGDDEKAIEELVAFRTMVAGARPAPEAEVRDVLIRDTDAMIERLGGEPSAAGPRANDGKSLTGTGRLASDPTRVKGRKL